MLVLKETEPVSVQITESSAVSSRDKRWITSLRTETLSMLGGLYLIRSITMATNIQTPFTATFTYDYMSFTEL